MFLCSSAPHFFIVGGKKVSDISLNPSLSPSVTLNTDWLYGSIGGRGRIINNWFVVCGGTVGGFNANCTKRFVGNTLGTNDTLIAPEPFLHFYGFSLMLANNKQWQTGGQLASNKNFAELHHSAQISANFYLT
jgi:hypothetical protein